MPKCFNFMLRKNSMGLTVRRFVAQCRSHRIHDTYVLVPRDRQSENLDQVIHVEPLTCRERCFHRVSENT